MMLNAKARCYWKNSAEIGHGQVFRSTFGQELSSDRILIELRGAIKTSSFGIGKPWARELLITPIGRNPDTRVLNVPI
jgi:hypothetical protein